jgi:hypothetical protein
MTKKKNRAGKMLKLDTFLEWLTWFKKGGSRRDVSTRDRNFKRFHPISPTIKKDEED